ncbi:MAG: glycosyltransferase [Acidobacteria bacterium]|nr:glycosyltransferase [Acidobacteriota bacterium]
MIRVAHLIPSLGLGGAEWMLANLLSRTDRERFAPLVIALAEAGGPLAERIAGLDIPVYGCRMRRGIPDPAGALRLLRLARRERPDLLQGWMYHGNLAAQAAAALEGRGVPVIWNIRAANPELRREKTATALAIRLGAKLSGRPAAIVCNSIEGARLHGQRLGYRGRWEVIPNGFDCDRFAPSGEARVSVRAELGLRPETPLVGLISRYHPVKDHPNFLAAAARVKREAPEVRYVMAGNGVDAACGPLRMQIAALGLEGHVFCLGERRDVPRLTAALDLACSASWSEGFPTSIGEAMACGAPCVVTDVGDSGYLVGDTGLRVPPSDSGALAAAILDLMRREDGRRRELGRAARERIRRHFSLDLVAERYQGLYERTLRIGAGKGKPCAA